MLVIKIEMWPLGDEEKAEEIGRMTITNLGNHPNRPRRGNYFARVMRRGTTKTVQRAAHVEDYPRQSYPVWELVRRALNNIYRGEKS